MNAFIAPSSSAEHGLRPCLGLALALSRAQEEIPADILEVIPPLSPLLKCYLSYLSLARRHSRGLPGFLFSLAITPMRA